MKTYVLLLFLLWLGMFKSQGKPEEDVKGLLKTLVDKDLDFIKERSGKYTPIVSAYTYNQMVKKDFSMLVTGSTENNQVGKYAALSIDKNEQSFSLSPIIYIPEKKDEEKFRHVFSINTSGKLNNNGFFDFSNRKLLRVGGSWTALLSSRYSYGELSRETRDKNKEIYGLVREDLIKKMDSQDKLEKIKSDQSDYKQVYHQEVEKYENLVYKNIWTTKFLAWTKLDVGYSEDKLKIIDSINVQNSVMDPMNKSISGAYFSLSGNIYYGSRKGFGLYLNAQLSYSKKTSLSEIFSTVEWNRIRYGSGTNNTVYYDIEEHSVYITNFNTLKQKYKRDISVQVLCFIPLGQSNLIGLDVGYQNKEFITPGTTTFTSNKNIFSVGIMFPLRDKDGKTTINIEPFWRNTSFSNYDEGKEESFWGVKFGVPLNQLF
ncbi:hypothetical protein B0A69_04190 [Chryseobacterium shigense]|uniref:Uncharacterized protein n=1 Tax=Chryseobacterium shigense TaxID=297244 RepID=A0A1N7IR26_9FLAO|nr:hypothetical protein [Chryseobacterium shigense]PQA95585.1 hypothetical protein B0A69_04190 [Chryseobacterium shigense]SIS39534.1 hypothetical protein SAMN05421639_104434 [Chryseobacterium shigense]